MKIRSIYLNDLNRVVEDVNSLIWYTEKDDYKNAKIRADYIINEVNLLVQLIKKLKREVKQHNGKDNEIR